MQSAAPDDQPIEERAFAQAQGGTEQVQEQVPALKQQEANIAKQ